MNTSVGHAQVDERRLVLFSTRMRFMPHVQPIRETAIDKIIEQNLLLADEPLSVATIERQCLTLHGHALMSQTDVENSVRRLLAAGSVASDGQYEPRFTLSDKKKAELWSAQDYAEKRYKTVINRLFKGAPGGTSSYAKPFIECLALVFGRLGEAYVRHIKNEIGAVELLKVANLERAISDIKKRYRNLDIPAFYAGIRRFFEEVDPVCDELKWNLAQNYYVAKALGLDPSGRLLTKEIFSNAVFYIDTNVLVHALDPTGRHHHSFEVLSEACREIGIRLVVSQISIHEMRRVAALEKELISKKVDQKVPAELSGKLRGILLPAYLEEIKLTGECDLDRLFEKFDKPTEHLKNLYGIEVIDDKWFIEATDDPDILAFVDQVKKAYSGPSGRKKGENAALHDAMMIYWVEKERSTVNPNTWFVTLDLSLPSFKQKHDTETQPYALTLVALMQWLSPVGIAESREEDAAAIFAEALRQQLLPQESFFSLRDFLVFAEMEVQTDMLPAADVEDCIREIRATVPDLDPTSPRDRERLSHLISKFFVDPGRKYKATVEEHRVALGQLHGELQRHQELSSAKISSLQADAKGKADTIADLSRKLQVATSLGEARIRMLVLGLCFVAVEVGVGLLVNRFAEGVNFLQKCTRSWSLFVTVVPLWVVANWFVLGKQRLNALGFPFSRLLKAEAELEHTDPE